MKTSILALLFVLAVVNSNAQIVKWMDEDKKSVDYCEEHKRHHCPKHCFEREEPAYEYGPDTKAWLDEMRELRNLRRGEFDPILADSIKRASVRKTTGDERKREPIILTRPLD